MQVVLVKVHRFFHKQKIPTGAQLDRKSFSEKHSQLFLFALSASVLFQALKQVRAVVKAHDITLVDLEVRVYHSKQRFLTL